ncbi:long-chain fatty acid--CoA ligase, partial [Staphylococcus warneri]
RSETRLLNQDDDAVGLLAVRSEMVLSGYVGQSNQEGAWIKTGDFAYIKNQHLFLVGRESDRIIVGGINVYPTAIESLIMDIEGIDEALVIGIPHAKFGEIAILLYSGKVQLNYRQIKSFLMKHLSRQEVPSKLKK